MENFDFGAIEPDMRDEEITRMKDKLEKAERERDDYYLMVEDVTERNRRLRERIKALVAAYDKEKEEVDRLNGIIIKYCLEERAGEYLLKRTSGNRGRPPQRQRTIGGGDDESTKPKAPDAHHETDDGDGIEA